MNTRNVAKKYILDLETPLSLNSDTRSIIYRGVSIQDESLSYTIRTYKLSDLSQTDVQEVVQAAHNLQTFSHHRNMALTLDVIEEDNILYTVFPLFDGDLQRYLEDRRGGLQENEAKHIFRQVISAILYFKKSASVHRVFQPSDFLIDTRSFHVVLADVGPTPRDRINTQYLAPEYHLDEECDCTKSDVYSLGVLLFNLVSGRLPFEDEDGVYYYSWVEKYQDSLTKEEICRRPLPPIPMSISLSQLLERMLALRPKSRFSLNDVLQSSWVKHPTLVTTLIRRMSAFF
eukprot:TRINITY_DN9153_c0_g1_i1.p1 TRINITY_DN9153_c0_g1~~TRINITY_DN9153_c0_g1_i1.p1  ORF type:complete len:288 (-),score=35.02 TRINITY_DN9153_c0_g1_i1:142-1005(-)